MTDSLDPAVQLRKRWGVVRYGWWVSWIRSGLFLHRIGFKIFARCCFVVGGFGLIGPWCE